ncbi:uncharacterized protein BXIN_2117 [Babesia sp. Xinjiang]|uniref:uncharacterized protein n=1 Tax=Babesia sp. Xinjiang TaxID=462227 RepID=UPI000A21E0DF|nr:uncharacterized protein BXIN_2117 [Babesia sp. Xinjiang]ORM40591.1 hypothetical protein BXIN_2117 [Babesia sp. Xinjiang]
MERVKDSANPPQGQGTPRPSETRQIFNDRYECWSNEVSTPVDGNVFRENKAKYKNVQIGPVMSATEVDALLCRKPNAVRNFINSLNEQMRQRFSPVGAAEVHSTSPINDYEPEFDREIKECNVSVKSRINIFDKRGSVTDSGARLMPADSTILCSETGALSSSGAYKAIPNNVERTSGFNATTSVREIYGTSASSKETSISQGGNVDGHSRSSSDVDGLKLGDRTTKLSCPHSGYHDWVQPSGRSQTDVVPCGSSQPPKGLNALNRWVSDLSSDSARDPFETGHRYEKTIPQDYLSLGVTRFRIPGDYSSYSPQFGAGGMHETAATRNDRAAWTPSVRTSRSFNDAAIGSFELPLNLVKRDSDINAGHSDKYPYAAAQEPGSHFDPLDSQIFTVCASGRDIRLRTVNVVKAGWTWMHSMKAKRWFPKYLVLFYDEPHRPRKYQVHATMRNRQAPVTEDMTTESNFWDIYKIYSHLSQDNGADDFNIPDSCSNVAQLYGSPSTTQSYNQCMAWQWNVSETGVMSVVPKSPNGYYLDSDSVTKQPAKRVNNTLVLIPDGASVYLTILNEEVTDVYGAVRRGEFRELMEVDIGQVPYTKLHAPKHWLASLIARSMGRDPMNLIHIPLVDGYECVFMPLSAAKFPGVTLSYEMQCALANRVGREYEHWLFSIWEFVLRSGKTTSSCDSLQEHKVRPPRLMLILSRWLRRALTYIASMWPYDKDLWEAIKHKANINGREAIDVVPDHSEEQSPLQSVLMCGGNVECGVGTPEHKRAVTHGFAQWVQSRGFDDLSVSMNFYTLTNRA